MDITTEHASAGRAILVFVLDSSCSPTVSACIGSSLPIRSHLDVPPRRTRALSVRNSSWVHLHASPFIQEKTGRIWVQIAGKIGRSHQAAAHGRKWNHASICPGDICTLEGASVALLGRTAAKSTATPLLPGCPLLSRSAVGLYVSLRYLGLSGELPDTPGYQVITATKERYRATGRWCGPTARGRCRREPSSRPQGRTSIHSTSCVPRPVCPSPMQILVPP